MMIDYDAIKAEASAFLRDEDGVYEAEIASGLRYALRTLRQQGVLDTQREQQITLPANSWRLPLDQFETGEIRQIDWAWIQTAPVIWQKLTKTPYKGADLSRLTPPVGRPYRWSLWGKEVVFDGIWQQDSFLRIFTEMSFGTGADLPEIGEQYYDAVLQLTVAYVQINYLNIDASAAKGQAEAAVQRLLESRDRQLSTGTIQPFIY